MGRKLGRAAVVLVVAAVSIPWIGSTSYAIEIPKTLFRLLKITAADEEGMQRVLPFSATELGLTWDRGPIPQLRTSDGTAWTAWKTVSESEDMFDAAGGRHYSNLIDGREARRVEVRSSERGEGISGLAVAVINTQDGPLRRIRLLRSLFAATGQPQVVSRQAWGADESLRRGTPSFSRVKKVFVHHSVTSNRDADPAATMRAMMAYHVQARGWDDIGYNFSVDAAGRIYEGRYARGYRPGEIPTGEDANGMGVVGAHTVDANSGSMGVAVLGNTDTAAPTAAATGALTDLLAWHADRHGINPLGSDPYVNPAGGASGTFPNISGHRDSPFASTRCPGRHLYGRLPAIRSAVESVIASTGGLSAPGMPVASRIAPASPSADGTPEITGDVSRSAARVDVTFTGGLLPRTVSAVPAGGSYTVGDAAYGGVPLAPGKYSVSVVAFDASGRASPAGSVASGYTVSGQLSLLDALLGYLPAPAAGTAAADNAPAPGPLPGLLREIGAGVDALLP